MQEVVGRLEEVLEGDLTFVQPVMEAMASLHLSPDVLVRGACCRRC